MEIRTYTERSNARRAARVAGVNPDCVFETDDGFTFPLPADHDLESNSPPVRQLLVEKQRVVDTADPEREGTIVRAGPEQSEVREANGKTRIVINSQLAPAPADDGLDIPDFCKLTQEQRRSAWEKNPPKAAAAATKPETLSMTKNSKSKRKRTGPSGPSGADKTATLLSMLKGKGSTVEQLTKALDWLPHTLRARISRLNKPKSKGGEGLKVDRERVDSVTTYRLAS